MKVDLEPRKYIVAVSGGVDSMVLLDLLAKQVMSHEPEDRRKTQVSSLKTQDLVVAHFDHGIHEQSKGHYDFVAKECKRLGLELVSEAGNLGPKASEATARKARYEFLEKVKKQHKADAILTAHHRDDVLETAIINLLRGSGRKGLSSLKSTAEIKRPLLGYTKKQIIEYAKKHGINWREDPTNLDTSYLRNYVRHEIIPRLSEKQKNQLMSLIKNQYKTNQGIEHILAALSQEQLNRKLLISLSHSSAKELIAEFMRVHKISFDSKLLEKIVVFTKTAKEGKKFEITKNSYFEIQDNKVKLNLL